MSGCDRVAWLTAKELAGVLVDSLPGVTEELGRAVARARVKAVRLRYSYGRQIVDGAKNPVQFHAPCERHCSDCTKVEDFFRDCGGRFPLLLVTGGCLEVNAHVKQGAERLLYGKANSKRPRRIPLRVAYRGDLVGAFEAADELASLDSGRPPEWEVWSGAQSLLALRNITANYILRRVARACKIDKEALASVERPADLASVIRLLATHYNSAWRAEVVLLPREVWKTIPLSVYTLAWRQSHALRTSSSIAVLLAARPTGSITGIDPEYLARTCWHLEGMQQGTALGFAVAPESDRAGPIAEVVTALGACDAEASPLAVLLPAYARKSGEVLLYSLSRPTIPALVRHTSGTHSDFLEGLRTAMRHSNPKAFSNMQFVGGGEWHHLRRFLANQGVERGSLHWDRTGDGAFAACVLVARYAE